MGIDIGGTKLLAAYSSDGRRLTTTAKIATPQDQRQAIPAIMKLIDQVAAGRPIASVGLAAPGPLDFERGIMLAPPNLPWRNFPIVKALQDKTRHHVSLTHDAAGGGLTEAILGAGQGFKRVLYITISTGIGTSLVIDGQIDHGQSNSEGGHITIQSDGPICSCGARGHFEAVVSGRAIKRRFGKAGYQITDPKIWDEIARDMAAGIASLAAITTPDVIVLGGGVSVHFARFKKPLAHHLGEVYKFHLPPVKMARFVETAPVIGALILASRSDHQLR